MVTEIKHCGDQALLVDFAPETPLDAVLDMHARIQALDLDAITDLVPAACTIVVHVDTQQASLQEVSQQLRRLRLGAASTSVQNEAQVVEIPTVYDGPDLHSLAQHLGVSTQELITAHTTMQWRAAFGGFAPGFTYLVPTASWFDVPRHPQPRPSIPAGSVGLAGSFSGVYPQSSPGGWQLLGTTAAVMWDVKRPQPALIQPGDIVRFVEVSSV